MKENALCQEQNWTRCKWKRNHTQKGPSSCRMTNKQVGARFTWLIRILSRHCKLFSMKLKLWVLLLQLEEWENNNLILWLTNHERSCGHDLTRVTLLSAWFLNNLQTSCSSSLCRCFYHVLNGQQFIACTSNIYAVKLSSIFSETQ